MTAIRGLTKIRDAAAMAASGLLLCGGVFVLCCALAPRRFAASRRPMALASIACGALFLLVATDVLCDWRLGWSTEQTWPVWWERYAVGAGAAAVALALMVHGVRSLLRPSGPGGPG